eukprot:TRINITY_DN1051_c0_g2_i1.p1 TRINITY_DN1051_c0_g2~~TRINITY_DN1051_c0_g2_i1.p1  ORF type:complete len:471 (-),score=86.77 TRINITY_DN1051_c0_g2_i1:222-1475(-)
MKGKKIAFALDDACENWARCVDDTAKDKERQKYLKKVEQNLNKFSEMINSTDTNKIDEAVTYMLRAQTLRQLGEMTSLSKQAKKNFAQICQFVLTWKRSKSPADNEEEFETPFVEWFHNNMHIVQSFLASETLTIYADTLIAFMEIPYLCNVIVNSVEYWDLFPKCIMTEFDPQKLKEATAAMLVIKAPFASQTQTEYFTRFFRCYNLIKSGAYGISDLALEHLVNLLESPTAFDVKGHYVLQRENFATIKSKFDKGSPTRTRWHAYQVFKWFAFSPEKPGEIRRKLSKNRNKFEKLIDGFNVEDQKFGKEKEQIRIQFEALADTEQATYPSPQKQKEDQGTEDSSSESESELDRPKRSEGKTNYQEQQQIVESSSQKPAEQLPAVQQKNTEERTNQCPYEQDPYARFTKEKEKSQK